MIVHVNKIKSQKEFKETQEGRKRIDIPSMEGYPWYQ